jgi:hypothetical protein
MSLARIVAVILCLLGAVGSSMAGQAPDRGRVAAPVTTSAIPAAAAAAGALPSTPMPETQAASYAAREEAATGLREWKGGASLSITLGTTALVVVAILVALVIIF